MHTLEKTNLSVDEFESLRLADYDALSHEEAAERMNVSRATFGRILEKARYKIVDALLNTKAVVIEGGSYQSSDLFEFQCKRCKRKWHFVNNGKRNVKCPYCEKSKINN